MEIQNVPELRVTWGRREWILGSSMSLLPGVYWRPLQFRTPSKLVHEISIVTQSCPTLCDPMDCISPGSSVHGDSPGKNTGVGCHFLLQGSNLGLLHWRQILYHLSHKGSRWPTSIIYIKSLTAERPQLPIQLGNVFRDIFYMHATTIYLSIYLLSIHPSIHPSFFKRKFKELY